jgi:GMP synthase (glutamine-hydrolysing)
MILVVDYGGTQVQSTARKLRGDRIYCEILPPNAVPGRLSDPAVKGIFLAGEPDDEVRIDEALFSCGIPLLAMGACARRLCVSMGGKALAAQVEARTAQISFADSPLFDGLIASDRYFERVDMLELPEGCEPIAFSPGHNRSAVVRLMTTTGAAPSRSDSSNDLPASRRIPSVRK